jgi:hypothetical protein
MQRVLSAVVIAGCLGSSTHAQQASPFKSFGESVRTVDPPSDWSRVRRIAPGRAIVIRTRAAPSTTVTFVQADDSELTVLTAADLPPRVRRTLIEGSKHPPSLRSVFSGTQIIDGEVQVRPDGIFLANQKVAETGEVIRRIPQAEIVAIETPPARRGSVVGAVVGAAAGFVVGYRMAVHFAYAQCNGSCGGEQAMMGVSLVGMPVAGSLLGYQSKTEVTRTIIYSSP